MTLKTYDFSEVMARLTDKELAEILITKRDEYQEKALEAAQHEVNKRGLNINKLITTEDISEAVKRKLPPHKQDLKLNVLYKIVTFLFPGYTKYIIHYLWLQLSETILGIYYIIAIIIVLQIFIYVVIKKKGYTALAADFRLWSTNSWIPFGILFVLFPIIKVIYYIWFYGSN